MALTTDGWTSRPTQSFVTVTATLINDDWQLENYVVQTRAQNESHTGKMNFYFIKLGVLLPYTVESALSLLRSIIDLSNFSKHIYFI